MAVNYEDERFAKVEAEKETAMNELDQTYNGIIEQSDDYYNSMIDASKDWADTQSQLQQEQTDFTIEKIEQQKDQAQKDYTKEQSGAYVDWKKQSNNYGVGAEQRASAGLAGSGFSESSQVSMYNTYQNRVATAREVFNQAVLSYDNAIKDARLQNSAALAEIAYQSLQTQLELSLQGFQYKNQLVLEQANKKVELDNMYYNRYMDVLEQINHENTEAEQIRQFNLGYELDVKALDEEIRQFNQEYDLKIKEFNEGIRQFEVEIAELKQQNEIENQFKIQELELEKASLEEEKRQFEEKHKLDIARLEEEKRQFNTTMDLKKSSSSGNPTYETPKPKYDPPTENPVTPSAFNSDSVMDLGLGPISDAGVAELEAAGAVTTYKKDNQLYVKKTPYFDARKNTSNRTNNILPTVDSKFLIGNTGTTPKKATNPIKSQFPWLNY